MLNPLRCVAAKLAHVRTRQPSLHLLNNFRNRSRAYRVSAFADGKPQTLLHGHRRDQLNHQLHIVARHHHLRACRQFRHARHVRRTEIELRTIALEERRMTAAFFLGQNVDFAP